MTLLSQRYTADTSCWLETPVPADNSSNDTFIIVRTQEPRFKRSSRGFLKSRLVCLIGEVILTLQTRQNKTSWYEKHISLVVGNALNTYVLQFENVLIGTKTIVSVIYLPDVNHIVKKKNHLFLFRLTGEK